MRSSSLRVLSLLSLCLSLSGLAACASPAEDSAAEPSPDEPAAGGLAMPMALSRARAGFDADGVTLARQDGASIRLRLESWGREGALQAVDGAEPKRKGCEVPGPLCGRVEQARAGVTEWWIGLDSGVEQGFTIHERPLGGPGFVGFSLATEGALLVETDGETARLTDAEGESWSVGGLAAWDADGAALPVFFEAEGATLRMWVDDTGARYPVTVDPVYSTYAAMISPLSSYAGRVIAGVGDVDADGYDDIAVGDPEANGGDGAVYIYRGSASGPQWMQTLTGTSSDENFGSAIAGGDVDGDGYSDVVVGAPGYSSDDGKVYVFEGSSRTIRLTSRIYGSGEEELGASVAVGDLNNDGRADIVAGAPGYFGGSGRVVLVLAGQSATTLLDWPAFVFSTPPRLGESLAIVPDLDQDGYADVAIGAPDFGAGYVAVVLDARSNMESSDHSWLSGATSGDEFGMAIAGIGDIHGDGYGELLVGAPEGMLGQGIVYMYRGSASGVSTSTVSTAVGSGVTDFGRALAPLGDIDADGYTDFAVNSVVTSTVYHRLYIYSPGGSTSLSTMTVMNLQVNNPGYASAIAGAGDIDADGYDDLLVNECFLTCAATYVYQGYVDADGDGASAVDDCDDADAAIYPGATELIDNGQDDDCDGLELCYVDHDRDGYPIDATTTSADSDCTDPGEHGDDGAARDCDDGEATVHVGAVEATGDGVDGDCDGVELCYIDADEDDFRTEQSIESTDLSCAEPGLAPDSTPSGDCDDNDYDVRPGGIERVGDSLDSDCDGTEVCYADNDNDGVRPNETAAVSSADIHCLGLGEATADAPIGDCDDDHATVRPGADERPGDGIDQDCDGQELCFTDGDGDGVAGETPVSSADLDCLDAGELGLNFPGGDCDDAAAAVYPGAEEQADDGVDQDCDGEDTVSAPEQKGCSTAGSASSLGWLTLLGLALARRR